MRFKVVGADSETGDDVDMVLEAASQPEVERLAHDKHILVSTIAALPGGPPPQPAHADHGNHGAHAPAQAHGHAPAQAHGHAPGAAPAAHPPAAPARAPLHTPKPDLESISLVDDDPPAGGDPAAPRVERAHGIITVSANSPSEKGSSNLGGIAHEKPADVGLEYHIILNQSLFLLESAVNKQIREGWEPQGGLSVATSNNALQFFQSMIRRKKPAVAAGPDVAHAAAPAAGAAVAGAAAPAAHA